MSRDSEALTAPWGRCNHRVATLLQFTVHLFFFRPLKNGQLKSGQLVKIDQLSTATHP